MIAIKNLSKSYGNHQALIDININIDKGGVVAFLGPNGAGKSTLIRSITGYLPFDSGTINVCGIDIAKDPLAVKRIIGYLPESNPLYHELRVNEFLSYRAGLKDVARRDLKKTVDRSLSLCGITHVQTRIIGQLSKGYRQRVGLADCLLGNPELIILDEPMVGLDPNQLGDIKKLIVDLGAEKTVFLSTHVLQDVEELARQVVIINNGKLLTVDTPKGLIAKSTANRIVMLKTNEKKISVDSFSVIDSALEVKEYVVNSDGVTYLFETKDDSACRNEIITLFGKNGWFFQEMSVKPIRLSDIFTEITTNEGNGNV